MLFSARNKFFQKIHYPGMTISNRSSALIGENRIFSCSFFFSLRQFFRFRLIVKFFLFFSPPRHDFTTLSLLSVVSTLDYIFLRFSLSLTIFSIPNPPFPSPLFHHNFLSLLLPRSKLSTKLQSPVKGFYSSTLFDHVYLPSIPSTPSFPFSHTFEKTRNSPEQIFNPSYLSRAFQPPKKPKPVVKIQPRARSSIQKGKRIDSSPRNRTLSSRTFDTFRKFIPPPHHSSGSQSNRPANFGPRPEIVSF